METILTKSLSKRFGDSFQLGPLNLTVEPSEILGVMGPHGAGKTTLLRLLWGFVRPDDGTALVFGMRPHLEQIKVRLRSGFLCENPHFYDTMSATSFLSFIGHFYGEWDPMHAESLLDHFKVPGDTPIQNLSKGHRVKLGLISAVGHRPSLLILDEPTSHLDPLLRVDILQFLHRLAKTDGVTIVLSSHISDDLDQLADSILMLNDGVAVEYAKAADLQRKYKLERLAEIFENASRTEHHS